METSLYRYRSQKDIEKDYKRTGKCNRCAECCKFVAIGIPESREAKKYFKGFGFEMKGDWMILRKKCKYLKYNKCSIFNTKKLPIACAQFPIPRDGVYLLCKKKCSFKFPEEKREVMMCR